MRELIIVDIDNREFEFVSFFFRLMLVVVPHQWNNISRRGEELLFVLLDVAVGESGRSPHMKASAVSLYI